MFREERKQALQGEVTSRNAGCSAEECQKQIPEPKLALNPPSRCSECEPSRHLGGAAEHAYQGQPREIGARNQQNKCGGEQQGQNLRAQCGRLSLLERHGMVSHLCAGIVAEFISTRARRPGAVDFGVGLLPRVAFTQPSDTVKVGPSALAVPAWLKRNVHIRIERRYRTVGKHSDDCVALAFEQNGLS